ncbi:hypothetical protein L3X38_033472 [Prunus dulcis]|uniref:Transposase MuDR plant domain-containing protein n=1 Tax=Prunus dulcis TaxID=3755 RepID=A0AAD4YWZ8_PRUDU|nr:hypothetical protein L3X38_033472 [Prunus dulcis]
MLRVNWSFLHLMLKWLKLLVTYHPIRLLCYTIVILKFLMELGVKHLLSGLVWNGDYDYDVDAENCGGDVTLPFIDELADNDFSQVKEVGYNEDEETFENVGTKMANEDIGAELPNQDVGVNMTIDDEGGELPNKDEDSKFKDSDYEFNENEPEVRATVQENIADEGTTHEAQEMCHQMVLTHRNLTLEVRKKMKFSNKNLLIEAIKEHAIIHGREVKLIKNDKRRVQAKCVEDCSFQVYGSKIDIKEGTFAIKDLSLDHECGMVDKLRYTTSN